MALEAYKITIIVEFDQKTSLCHRSEAIGHLKYMCVAVTIPYLAVQEKTQSLFLSISIVLLQSWIYQRIVHKLRNKLHRWKE